VYIVLTAVGYLQSVSGTESARRLVRVYAKTIEYEDFPMPGHVTVTSYKAHAGLVDTSVRSVSLHHLIRHGDSPTALFIRNIDQRILRNRHHGNDDDDDDSLTSQELELHRAAIKERELELLMAADVILCTCVVASEARVASSTNIMQVPLYALTLTDYIIPLLTVGFFVIFH